MLFFNRQDKIEIEAVVGRKFERKYLKRWTIWIRKAIMNRALRTPDTYLLKGKDNKKYKLIISYNQGSHFIESIYSNYLKICHLNFCPKLLKHNKRFLLFEYIEGKISKFDDKSFAAKLGNTLAEINKIDLEYKSKNFLMEEINIYLNKLGNLIENHSKIRAILEHNLPDQVPYGITYGDHNVGNYVWKENQLYLIDMGSFVSNTLIDDHTAGSILYQKINMDDFKKYYLDNGGESFLFEYDKSLKLISLLKSASYNFGKFLEVPWYDWRLRNARKHNYTWGLSEIHKTISEF